MSTRAWWVCALAALASASCGDDAAPLTQAVVVVRSDLEIGAQLTHLRLELTDPSGEDEIHRGGLIPLAARDPEDGEYVLPLSFGIVPEGGDASLRFLLNVRGYGPLGEGGTDIEVVRESVLTGFLAGETTTIQVFLGRQCLQKLCDGGGGGTLMSCDYRSGTCGDIRFIPPLRAPFDPGTLVSEGCADGFDAEDGECVDIDECEGDDFDCGARASCDNTAGGYRCLCADDSVVAHGEDCDAIVDEPPPGGGPCDDDPCDPLAECSEQGDDFVCTCPSGYEPNPPNEPGCTDIDECDEGSDDCDELATCVNEPGGYRCEGCPDGYTDPEPGELACVDVPECALGSDGCDDGLSCVEAPGTFQCTGCGDGFVDPEPGDTTCVDIPECELNTDGCDALATCEETDGSFRCDCPPAYMDPPEGMTECTPLAAGCEVRVRPGGNDANDGSTWALAKATLSAALEATGACEVWLAEGTYVPTRDASNEEPVNPRDRTFLLKAGVPVYGGFAGTESARSQRDFLAHPTVLSGNIGAAGATDNVYHVVTGVDGATLSGVFVAGGYAQEIGAAVNDLRNQGGGMLNSALTDGIAIDQVVFVGNRANFGGGMANRFGTTFEVDDSVFLWNHGVNGGGGLSASAMVSTTEFTTGTITSSTFFGNSGTYGVGAWANQAAIDVRNCTFQANVTAASQSSGALDLATPPGGTRKHTVINSSFIGNTGVKGAALWVDSNAPDVIGCSFIDNVSDTSACVATRELSPPAQPRLYNCLFWNNAQAGNPVDISTEEGGAPVVDAGCSRQNLEAFGDANANVRLNASPSPLASVLPSGVAFLSQSATAPTCLDAASSVHATAASIPWSSLTTASDGRADMTSPDAGRHVSPDAVRIDTLSANGTTLTWTSTGATSCAWLRKDDNVPHGVPASTTSVSHGSPSGTALAVLCHGPEGEPAVAGVLVP